MAPTPFTIDIAQGVLDDLRTRLDRTRWVDDLGDAGWKYGASIPYMRELVAYWRDRFDWRAQERALNGFANFRATMKNGLGLHSIHERGRGPRPLPIVLTHGFPDSVVRFTKLIPMLVDPAGHGADAADSFDVVAPSLPGYAFSDPPRADGTVFHIGDLWNELMTAQLGYDRYVAHGGDWGSTITELLARDHGTQVVAIHLTDVPFFHAFRKPDDLSHAEQKYLDSIAGFQQAQGAINTSFLPYYDAQAGAITWIGQKLKEWASRTPVPSAFAMYPKDLSSPPREWAERFFDVRRWTEMQSGGHVAALEEPESLARDIREFFRPFRSAIAA